MASLPCYTPGTVDAQRGAGVFGRSIAGLQALNAVGYGRPGSGLELDLVYNPGGPFLAPDQATLEVGPRQLRLALCRAPPYTVMLRRQVKLTDMLSCVSAPWLFFHQN